MWFKYRFAAWIFVWGLAPAEAPLAREPENHAAENGDTTPHPDQYGIPINSAVFIRGEAIPAPFRIGHSGRRIFINDVLLCVLPRTVDQNANGKLPVQNPLKFVANLERRLYQQDTLIAFDEHVHVLLPAEDASWFVSDLLKSKTLNERIQTVLRHDANADTDGMGCVPTTEWRRVLTSFEATEALKNYADIWDIGGELNEPADPDSEIEMPTKFDATGWMYALNVVGMLLIAAATGTLLGYRPDFRLPWNTRTESLESAKLVRSLAGLIGALTVFDLAATILTEISGEFIELNPFANAVLHDSLLLASFKLAVTSIGIGILLRLRHYAGAQVATWWCCIVLTLVAGRWIVIQSMFYA